MKRDVTVFWDDMSRDLKSPRDLGTCFFLSGGQGVGFNFPSQLKLIKFLINSYNK